MAWNNLTTHALGLSGQVTLNTTAWRKHLGARWYWLLLLLVALPLLGAILRRRRRRTTPIDNPWQDFVPSIKNPEDSPFFAYLGHNALTESSPSDPNNTSVDAIGRIPDHFKNTGSMDILLEEPQQYESDVSHALPPMHHQYPSYTYPDIQTMQIRFDRVEQIRDDAHDCRWQRHTMHICTI